MYRELLLLAHVNSISLFIVSIMICIDKYLWNGPQISVRRLFRLYGVRVT